MNLTSQDFEPEGRLADRHTASGANRPPLLTVTDLPDGTMELALIVHDPDAPLPQGFTHWLRYGLPPRGGVISGDDVPHHDGVNDFGNRGYDGPEPPPGHGLHHYYFWVYALGDVVDGEPTRDEFLRRYAHSIIGQQRIVATYSR